MGFTMADNERDTMRHEISPQEAREIHKARTACICSDLGATGWNQRHTLCPAHAVEAREQRELDEHQSRMEIRYGTQ